MKAPHLESFLVKINGDQIIGGLYHSGRPKAPTAILIHGIPGFEKYMGIAYALQEAGWNCLYFHYRGCWGSTGDYQVNNHLIDIQAAHQWLIQRDDIDSHKLALIGSSLGGHNTLKTAINWDHFAAYLAICPVLSSRHGNLGREVLAGFTPFLHGVEAEDLENQWSKLQDLEKEVHRINSKKLCMLTGDQDALFAPETYVGLAKKIPHLDWRRHPHADHSFSGHQSWCTEHALSFLQDTIA